MSKHAKKRRVPPQAKSLSNKSRDAEAPRTTLGGSTRTWQAIAALSVLVTLATGYLSLLPRLSIRPPSARFQMDSPFMSPFVIVNDGVLPVWNVEVTMYTGMVLQQPYDVCDGRRIQGTYSTAHQ